MTEVFSPDKPIVELDDLSTLDGKNKQNGFMRIYEGVMIGIRNPKAHTNQSITDTNAIHKLTLASMLFYEIDNATNKKLSDAR